MITFITGNSNKAAEAAAFFKGVVDVDHISIEMMEPQSSSLEEIAAAKAQQAYARLHIPLFVDDTGIFIEALGGFPGPYAAFVQETIGNDGILRLMEHAVSRRAYFATTICFIDEAGMQTFTGRVDGEIVHEARGTEGFGYDPIFAVNGHSLAEMTMEEKNCLSHRGRALSAFREWYIRNR